MEIPAVIAILLFFAAYYFITLEHRFNTHKSAISLALAGSLWIIAAFAMSDHHTFPHELELAGSEVFSIVAFLLAAMALVEILVHYRLFDIIRYRLAALKLSDRQQFVIIGILTFFMSAVLDNLTITIVMVQIARRFFRSRNLLIAVSGIVILANAGGAWSPIGDVTTIMLWLAGKFSAPEVITQGFIPSVLLGISAGALLVRQMEDTRYQQNEEKIRLTRGESAIIVLTLASFTLPLFMNFFSLPPYMGLLMGLGFVWIFIEFVKSRSRHTTHLEADIELLLKKLDISSIKFFIGILLSVSALKVLGVLEVISHAVFGAEPTVLRLVYGNVFLGLFSAVVDNVPLTALAIDIIKVPDPKLWVMTALAVGTGGSALVIGSVAGVVAMGMVKDLTFNAYLKIATAPALIGYAVAMIAWYVQYTLMS